MRLEIETNVTAIPPAHAELLNDNGFSSPEFEMLLKKGVAAAQDGDRDKARISLIQAAAIDPRSEDAWMWLASISEYPEELLSFLNRVLDINPDNKRAIEWQITTKSLLAKTFVQRAVEAHEQGSAELTEQCLNQALDFDSECEMAWFWKAKTESSEDQKIAYFERVLAINADNQDAIDGIVAIGRSRAVAAIDDAKAAAVEGKREEAIEILDRVLQTVPDNADAWIIRSHLLLDFDAKIDSLEKALEVDPNNAAARSTLDFLTSTFGKAKEEPALDAHEAAEFDQDQETSEVEEYVANEEKEDAPVAAASFVDENEGDESAPYLTDEAIEVDEAAVECVGDEQAEVESVDQTTCEASEVEDAVVECAVEEQAEFESDVETTNEVSEVEAVEVECAVDEQADVESGDPINYEANEVEEVAVECVVDEAGEEVVESAEARSENAAENDAVENITEEYTVSAEEAIDDDVSAVESLTATTDQGIDENVEEVIHNVELERLAPEDDEIDDILSGLDDVNFREQPVENVELSSDDQPQVEAQSAGLACPYCSADNDPQAFECTSCQATLTLSDIESLMSNSRAKREVIQEAVTQMEAEWNLRECSETELTALGIGYFNLHNYESGLKFLQEASRLNPNNVILSGQVNAIAIRIEETRRQEEVHDAMPKGKTILVVDDSPTVRKLISGKLEKSGHNVVCAVDGVDALERMAESRPDLVLLDITMPRMDGYEVCKHIRANPESKDIPVVMISGKDGFFDKVRGRLAGSTGYVTKPFGPETLMKALETYLLPEDAQVG